MDGAACAPSWANQGLAKRLERSFGPNKLGAHDETIGFRPFARCNQRNFRKVLSLPLTWGLENDTFTRTVHADP